MSKQRIDYIDLIKGIAIFFVVWVHTEQCTHLYYHNSANYIFFFLSALFYKELPFRQFFTKRVKTILVPFLFFYTLSYPFRMLVFLWDHHTLTGFPWTSILDVFKVLIGTEQWLTLNVPLWFFLSLFLVQVIFYFLQKAGNAIMLTTAIVVLVVKCYLGYVQAPLQLDGVLNYLPFFCFGYLTRDVVKHIKTYRNGRAFALLVSALLITAFNLLSFSTEGTFFSNLAGQVYYLSIISALLCVTSFLDGAKWMAPIRFLGNNSGTILGTHLWALIPIRRVFYKYIQIQTPLIGFVESVIALLILVFLIFALNRYCPRMIGKNA